MADLNTEEAMRIRGAYLLDYARSTPKFRAIARATSKFKLQFFVGEGGPGFQWSFEHGEYKMGHAVFFSPVIAWTAVSDEWKRAMDEELDRAIESMRQAGLVVTEQQA